MQRYKNISGTSGILYYEIGRDFIKVMFKNNTTYLYTAAKVTIQHIEEMKKLAVRGEGLGTYINQHKEIKEHFTLIT